MKNGFMGIMVAFLIVIGLVAAGGYYFLRNYSLMSKSQSGIVPSVAPLKPQEPVVGGDKDAHGCIGSAGYSWCEVKQKCLRNWEEPCVSDSVTADETENLKSLMKQAIVAKHGSEANSLNITVAAIEGDYAKGGASGQGGGGLWFAAKVNGTWQLVWDGNGIIRCSDLAAYPQFPNSMISGCYDETAGKLINR